MSSIGLRSFLSNRRLVPSKRFTSNSTIVYSATLTTFRANYIHVNGIRCCGGQLASPLHKWNLYKWKSQIVRSFHQSVNLLHNPKDVGKNPNAIGGSDHDHDHDHSDEEEEEEDHVEVNIHVPHHGKHFKLDAHVGETLMDLVLKEGEVLSEYFECACGGIAACSTCHIYLDEQSYKSLGRPEEFELDMLDLSYDPKGESMTLLQSVYCFVILAQISPNKKTFSTSTLSTT
jgi:ferredoxin